MIDRDKLKTYISFKIELSGFKPEKLTSILNAISSYAPVKDFKTNATWSSSFIGELLEGQDPVRGIAITYLYKSDMMLNLFQRIVSAGNRANGEAFSFRFCGSYLNQGRFYYMSDLAGYVARTEHLDFF